MHIRAALVVVVVIATFLSVPLSAQVITGGGCTIQPFSFKFGPPFQIGFQSIVFTCADTAWFVFFSNSDRGLEVGPAFLIRDRASSPSAGIPVIQEASIAENITIYHDGKTRLNDSEFSTVANAIPTLNASLVGPGGLLLTDVNEARAMTAVELRERGFEHYETSLGALDSEIPFNNGYEGAMDLDPERFATVIIEDQMKNDRQHNIGYALQPFGPGTARHYAADERWTLHDIYVTRSKAVENAPPFGHGPASRPDGYLLGTGANQSGIFDHELIQNQHLVLWHRTSAHHDPHDEDQAGDDPTDAFKGITLIHWSGFDLVPHNLFNSNPLGSPHRKQCNGYP
jgi:hypothetical protein